MPHDHEAFADLVVMTVKAAMAPVLERLAAAEARIAAIPNTEKALSELRDRVVTVETKAASPIPLDAAVYELRERVMAIETKAMPVIEVPAEVSSRLAALETRPLVTVHDPVDLSPVLERVAKLELKSAEIAPVLASVSDVAKDIGAMRERMAVVEVRAQVPGPPGKDGANGKDGADGLGFEDMDVEFDGERSFQVKYSRGDRVKTAGAFTVAIPIYRGIFAEGKTYQAGDVVTYAGNAWYCRKETTVKPDYVGQGPQPKDFWTLMVKQGRDGRDGKDAPEMPVVSVGRRP